MTDDLEAEVFRDAARLTGLDLEILGAEDSEVGDPDTRARSVRNATLLAGLLWMASEILIDQLFDDVETVRQAFPEEPADISQTLVLSDLPERFHGQITPGVAQKFLVAAVDLTGRLTKGWEPAACVAQELMLRSLLNQVLVLSEVHEVDLDPHWRSMLEDSLFEDLDHEFLFDRSLDGFEDDPDFGPGGMAPMSFNRWFVPFNEDRHLPPYAEDVTDPA